jgi:hypothetical protein
VCYRDVPIASGWSIAIESVQSRLPQALKSFITLSGVWVFRTCAAGSVP